MALVAQKSALTRVYAWFSAVADEDTTLLEDLLAHGMPIDTLHPLRHTSALMEATRLGRAGMVQWLLEHSAAPAFLCGMPLGSALHCALRLQRWDIAHTLANAMPHCAVMDAYGATPLHILCAESSSDRTSTILLGLATIFVKKKCSMNTLDREGTTALHHCVINGHTQLASLLLRYGADPNALIPDSHVSPLTIAALEKNLIIARLLMQFGGDPHLRTREGSSPISIYPEIAALINETRTTASETRRIIDMAIH